MIPTRFSAMLLLSGTLFLLSGCGPSVTVVDEDSSAEVDLVEFPEPPNAEELLAGAWVLPDGGILTFSTAEKPESDEPDFGLKYQGTYTSSAGENAEFQWQFMATGFAPVTDGTEQYFENSISVQCDDDAIFPWPNTMTSVGVRFPPSAYDQGQIAIDADDYDPDTGLTTLESMTLITIKKQTAPADQ